MKNIFKFLVLIVMLTSLVSCKKTQDPVQEEIQFPPAGPFKYNRDLLFGMCEPLYLRALTGDIDVEAEVDIMYQLGIRSLRLWMEIPVVLNSPTQANPQVVSLYKQIISECKKKDIVIIGVSTSWNYLDEYRYNRSLPDRNTDPNSDYMKWMVNTWEKNWNTMAATFPEIEFWEIANETNNDVGLHKLGYSTDETKVFTLQEKADITTDLMYYSSLGIHQGNIQAQVVMPGASPMASSFFYGFERGVIESFISKMYANIKSGKWPSKNPRDFFDVACWHPYYTKIGWIMQAVDDEWLAINNKIYDVCKTNGDDGVPVFLSEFGYSDLGINSKDVWQAVAMTNALNYIKNDMPYVKVVNIFRLFDSPRDGAWGGQTEIYHGLFRINGDMVTGYTVIPKEKAKAYANFIGAGRDIYKYSK